MKRILLTGANGFIGRHCVPQLVSRGYEVHAVTRERTEAADLVRWHKVDLLDQQLTTCLLREVEPTHLLHLAWYTVPGEYWRAPENLYWVSASLNLMRAFALYGGERIVAAGTCAEYDWSDGGVCVEGSTPLLPATLYGASKHAVRSILEVYSRETGLKASWGRVFMLYGPHEHPQRLVSSIVRGLLNGERVPCSHGMQKRDFLYVEDVASAFVALLDSDVTGAVNIASGRAVPVKVLVNKIAGLIGRPELVDFGAVTAMPSEPGLLVADIKRLRDEVGWLPRLTLEEGLERTIDWWRRQSSVTMTLKDRL